MNKQTQIIVIAGVAVLVLGVGAYFLWPKGAAEDTTTPQTTGKKPDTGKSAAGAPTPGFPGQPQKSADQSGKMPGAGQKPDGGKMADGGKMPGAGQKPDGGKMADGGKMPGGKMADGGKMPGAGQKPDGGKMADGGKMPGGQKPDGGKIAQTGGPGGKMPGPGQNDKGGIFGNGGKGPGLTPTQAPGAPAMNGGKQPKQFAGIDHRNNPFLITWTLPVPPPDVFQQVEPIRIPGPDVVARESKPTEVRETPQLRVSGIMSGEGVFAILEKADGKVDIVKPGTEVQISAGGQTTRTYRVVSINGDTVKLQAKEGKTTYTQVVPLSDVFEGVQRTSFQGGQGQGGMGQGGRPGFGSGGGIPGAGPGFGPGSGTFGPPGGKGRGGIK